MRAVHLPIPWPRPSLPFVLLAGFLGVLWLAGGASRADALGQVVVRSAAWLALIVIILFGERYPLRGERTLWAFLTAALLLTLLQLVPLPPDVWQALPGRGFFAEAAAASGQPQPWRPWSLVPGATLNAASSLIIPIVVLGLVTCLKERERSWLPGLVLCLITTSALLGFLQFSGAAFNNPLIGLSGGQVSGIFANRNHFALFTAFGCMLAPVWAFLGGRQPRWRGPVALGLVIIFALSILASGSRAGLLLGVVALGLGLLMVQQGIRKSLHRHPRWMFPALISGVVSTIAFFVLISVLADRAVSIDRVLAMQMGEDLRSRALPTILRAIDIYFPMGSGLGGFDPVFRIHEPFELLAPIYLNHAHNDFLEVAFDAGLPGIVLLLTALSWWAWGTFRAWKIGSSARNAMPKLGSAILALIMAGSIFDYPARTPMIMAVIVLAGVWLVDQLDRRPGLALPKSGQSL